MVYVNETRQYSKDGRLWVGMKENEVSKDKYEIFNYADKNCDLVLDESEINRYNGPVLVFERDDKSKQRFIGEYHGYSGIFPSGGHVKGEIISSKEFEFYPGQKFEEVREQDFNLVFRGLDLNSDRELSSEEIKAYQDYVEEKQEYNKRYREVSRENGSKIFKRTPLPVLGLMAGVIGIIVGSWCLAGRMGDSKISLIKKMAKPVGIVGSLGGTGLFVAKILNPVDKFLKKKTINPENTLEKEFPDLRRKDRQYKNVYVAPKSQYAY